MQSTSYLKNSTDSLKAILSNTHDCTTCSLYKTAKKAVNPVYIGNLSDIDFMFIGEGPGATEDATGKPFVGKAGILLQDTLVKLNITNNIYITNVVKHRPPDNRKPTLPEMQNCGDLFLKKEIEVVKPKAIICLGRTAAEYLIETSASSINVKKSLRGKTFVYNNILVMCTWHPAYVLRNRDKLPQLISDILLAKKELL